MKTIEKIFTAVALLIMTGVCSAQRINFDKTVKAGELILFQEVDNPNNWYYISDKPRIARDANGNFQFSFLRYVQNIASAPDQPENKEGEGGGIVHAIIELAVTQEQIDKAKQELRKVASGTIMGPVIYTGGNIALISSVANKEGGFAKQVIGLGKAPIMDGQKAAISISLTKIGAKILWETFKTQTPDLSVSFEMGLAGYRSPKHATIEANFDQIYMNNTVQAAIAMPILAGEIKAAFDDLEKSGAIKVTQIGEDTNMEKLIEAAYSKLIQMMFDQTTVSTSDLLNTANSLNQSSLLDRATAMLNGNSQTSNNDQTTKNEATKTDATKTDATKTDPTKTDPTKTDPTKTDPTKTDPTKTDPTKTDPTKTDPTKTDPTKTDPTKTDPTETDPTKTDPAKTDPTKTDPTKTDPTKTDPTKTDPTKTDPAKTDPTKTDPTKTDPAKTDPKSDTKTDTKTTPASNDKQTATSKPSLAIVASYSLKRVHQTGKFMIDLNKYTADNLTMRFDANLGNIKCDSCFRMVNLDDPLYKQREIVTFLDGANAVDFGSYINFVTLAMRKKHQNGEFTFDEVRIDRNNFNKTGNNFKMLYGWKGDNNRSNWLDYEYKTAWSFFGGTMIETGWTPYNNAALTVSTPYIKKQISIESDPDTLKAKNVRMVEVKLYYKINNEEHIADKKLNIANGNFSEMMDIIQPKDAIDYDYEITCFIKGGSQKTSPRKKSSSTVLFIEELVKL